MGDGSYEPYRALTTTTSDTNRYAEPAGSRRSDSHWQLDLNYTQNFQLTERSNLQLALDLFNVFDKQTGYNIEPQVHNSAFGTPRHVLRSAALPARGPGAVLTLRGHGGAVCPPKARPESPLALFVY